MYMEKKLQINPVFKKTLQNLGCGCDDDYINVTRQVGDKIYFTYGSCKLHVREKELETGQEED